MEHPSTNDCVMSDQFQKYVEKGTAKEGVRYTYCWKDIYTLYKRI